MVEAASSSLELLQPIAGRPGAGKTYATEAVVAAHVEAGVPIIGCAVSANAAKELERAAGFARSTGYEANTVARLLIDLDRRGGGPLRSGTVVVVDEASMIGTRDLARIAAHAVAAGGSVKLIGDPDQHGPVDVGGALRRLCIERGDRLVALVDNNRQEDHVERLAIAEYRDGHVADALGRYDEAGKIVRSGTAGESFDAIVADWYAAHLHGATDPMIAGPNSTRRALNERARALLKAHGELTGPALVIGGREFMIGDLVVARRNDRTLRSPSGRDFVKNGSAGVVTATDRERGEVVVDFDREGDIHIPHAYLAAGRLEHGYARTTFGVQGATQHTGRYHPTDVSSFEEGYVALTRARNETRIFVVDGRIANGTDDAAHVPAQSHPFGIREISDALARRRSGHMAADAASDLAKLADALDRASLADLHTRRRRLDRLVADAPADATRAIEETQRTLDAVRARRRAWQDTLGVPTPSGGDVSAARQRGPRSARPGRPARRWSTGCGSRTARGAQTLARRTCRGRCRAPACLASGARRRGQRSPCRPDLPRRAHERAPRTRALGAA